MPIPKDGQNVTAIIARILGNSSHILESHVVVKGN